MPLYNGDYDNIDTLLAWKSWKAAAAQALEQAAQCVECFVSEPLSEASHAANIRALITAPESDHIEDARAMVAAELREIAEYFASMGKMLNADLLRKAANMLEAADHFSHPDKMVPQPIPDGLLQRVQAALQRFLDDRAPRSIPAEPTDADLVRHEVEMLIKGEYKRPFWLRAAPADKGSHD